MKIDFRRLNLTSTTSKVDPRAVKVEENYYDSYDICRRSAFGRKLNLFLKDILCSLKRKVITDFTRIMQWITIQFTKKSKMA